MEKENASKGKTEQINYLNNLYCINLYILCH